MDSKNEELINKFIDWVLEKNKEFNLTSITNRKEFELKHIKDSLMLLEKVDWKYNNVIDIGTGAGIPGLILAMALPDVHFTLLDSNKKKIHFIKLFCEKYKIKNISLVNERAELYNEERYDLVIARAVTSVPKLIEIMSHLVKVNGEIILYKGRHVEEEMCERISKKIDELGLVFKTIVKYNLNSENKRSLVIYKKMKTNKRGYPRSWKVIKRKDLCK